MFLVLCMSRPHQLLPAADFLPQPPNASLRDSYVLFLYRPLLLPFLTPPPPLPSIIIALTSEDRPDVSHPCERAGLVMHSWGVPLRSPV